MIPSRRIARATFVVVAGLLTLWVGIGVTMSLSLAKQQPRLAHALWPVGTLPKIMIGTEGLTTDPSSETTRASGWKLATEAAIREPVNSHAVSLLASLADYEGDREKARSLFELAERLSRRNSVAQLWLIEDAVQRGDIGKAIGHYDRAMRVSVELRQALLPVLVEAANESAVRKQLVSVVAERPRWWREFAWLIASASTSPVVVADTLHAVNPDLGDPWERTLAGQMLSKLVEMQSYRPAVRLANRMEGLPDGPRTLQSGDFETDQGVLPFEWHFRDEGSLRGYREAVPSGSIGLRIQASSGLSGEVARQLVALSPGAYAISGEAGGISADRYSQPTISIACAAGASLGKFSLPAATDTAVAFRFKFTVAEADCEAQWISIASAPAVETDAWIDNLKITP